MSSTVWKCERTFEETLEKLGDIIRCATTSEIKMEWAYRAELCMEPAGWDALWRIPRQTCHKLGVRFPCVVYVTVESLDLERCLHYDEDELLATVEVVGVQDDQIHLPAKHNAVPICQLWPLRIQPNTAIDIKSTAEFIDLYRYFYTYIWMPWDADWEGGCVSWFDNNVPPRINMWLIEGADIHELRTIRDEAKSIAAQIIKTQADLPSDAENDDELVGDVVSELMVLHEKMQQLKSKWQTYQNPTIRKPEQIANVPPQNISIWTGGKIDSYVNHLREVDKWLLSTHSGEDAPSILQCSPTLEAALMANPPKSSKLFLCPGEHILPTDNTIGKNYTIIALSNDVKLTCNEERTAALAIVGSLTLDGIGISADECSTVLSIRTGNVALNQCKLVGGENVMSQAVIVFPGAQLKVSKCTFDEFFTGIIAHKGSSVLMDECTFSKCGVGVQVCEGAKVTMSCCSFLSCKEVGVRYETQELQTSIGGHYTLLEPFNRDISCMDCKFQDNKIHDVFVARLDENAKPEWEDN